MDKAQKKKLKQEWRSEQRQKARAALPLPLSELKAMFEMLGRDFPRLGCDHTRKLTKAWLIARGYNVERVFAWLDSEGGYCDCEVLANVEPAVDEAMRK